VNASLKQAEILFPIAKDVNRTFGGKGAQRKGSMSPFHKQRKTPSENWHKRTQQMDLDCEQLQMNNGLNTPNAMQLASKIFL